MHTQTRPASFTGPGMFKWLVAMVLIAICLLVFWPDSSLQETEIFVPAVLGGLPAGLTFSGTPLKGIEVRVRTSKSILATLPDLELRYQLDLSAVDVGIQSIRLEKERIAMPRGVSILELEPIAWTVRIEKEISKQLPVVVNLTGKPAAGFSVTAAVARPPRVTLKGPETVLGPLMEVMTKPIEIDGLTEAFKKEIALALAQNLELIDPPESMLAEISILEKIVSKQFADIPIAGNASDYDYRIQPAHINITVQGPAHVLEKLDPATDIAVAVDLKDLSPGVYERRASITLPVKTTLVGVEPEMFIVTIRAR